MNLQKMIRLQRDYDARSLARLHMDYDQILSRNGYFFAILDEVGEWNHERKALWCWFRKKEHDPLKELEEYCDILHMTLSCLCALLPGKELESLPVPEPRAPADDDALAWVILELLQAVTYTPNQDSFVQAQRALQAVLDLGALYPRKEVEAMFERKNRFNLERML